MLRLFNFLLEDRLYKFVYMKTGYSWDHKRTLVIVAKNVTDAVKKFYRIVDNEVVDILECTELTYPPINHSEGVENNNE